MQADFFDLMREMQDRGVDPGRIAEFLKSDDNRSAGQRFIQSGLNINALRPCLGFQTNATLDYDEWKQIDTAVIEEARTRTAAVQDLQARGLVHPLRNIGVMMSQYTRVTAKDRARVAMSVETLADRQRVEFDFIQVPIPVIFDEFKIDLRQLQASRTGGEGLDTTNARESSIVVAEELERMVISGATNIVVSGQGIYGYLTHPNRNTIATAADWGTPANIYDSVIAMKTALVGDRMYGPYTLYVSETQYMEAHAKEGVDRFSNVLARLMEIPGITDIKPTFALPNGTAVMVQLTPNTVDLALAQNISTVQWEDRGGWVNNFIVFAVMAPRIKADSQTRCGVVVHTGV